MTNPARVCGPLLAAALALAGCASGNPVAGNTSHIPVSVPPTTTAGMPSAQPTVTASGVATTPLRRDNFGMHVGAPGTWPQIPIGSFRIWNADSTWGALEPSPGAWNFAPLDRRIALAEESKAPVLLVLAMPPAWAATKPELKSYGGSPSMPSDVGAWTTYVRTVAERYAGRIEAYEIWNEPNLVQFWASSPGEMATLTETAASAIRGADPDALVVSPGLSGRTAGSTQFFSAYTSTLSPDAIDVIGLHVYPYPGDGPESMIAMTAGFRTLADDAGLAEKPMWNTEIGYGRTPDQLFSGDTAAGLILRTYLVLPSIGLERNYWYMWDDRAFVGLYLLGADKATPTESADAFVEAQRWLAGTGLLGCAAAETLWTCELLKDGVRTEVTWSLGGEVLVEVPAGSTVMYPFRGDLQPVQPGTTVPVGDLPVLFSPLPIPTLDS